MNSQIQYKDKVRFSIILSLVFFSLALLGILNHEMWRDEIHTWLVGQKSESLWDLIYQMRYDGHPSLWYICVYGLTRITNNAIAMQIFHVLLATGSVYLVSLYSPFSRLQIVLFSFGYFPFFEYALVSRSYALGVLLTFWCCKLITDRRRNYLAIAITLAAMANVSFYTLIVAFSILLGLSIELIIWPWLQKETPQNEMLNRSILEQRNNPKLIIYLAIVILGIAIALAQMQFLAPADRANVEGWFFGFNFNQLAASLSLLYKSLVPIPALKVTFWHQYIIGIWGQAPLFFPLLCFSILCLIRNPITLLIYLSTLSTIIIFNYTKYGASARHYGHIWIVFIACLWIAKYYRAFFSWKLLDQKIDQLFDFFNFKLSIFEKRKEALITGLLVCHLISGVYAWGIDLAHPFSTAEEASQFIKTEYAQEDFFLSGFPDWWAASFPAYLHQEIYHPNRNEFGTFVLWDNKREPISMEDAVFRVQEEVSRRNQNSLFITNTPLSLEEFSDLSLITTFKGSIVRDEDSYLYWIKNKK
ncbi:MAG: hypothetical protein EA366_05260 [Spirulina sp. DLM2.Bin59]|nr:MAG: hypothetical protein EA366_05260 [Spirulina sp. DLM2.Bin59]